MNNNVVCADEFVILQAINVQIAQQVQCNTSYILVIYVDEKLAWCFGTYIMIYRHVSVHILLLTSFFGTCISIYRHTQVLKNVII